MNSPDLSGLHWRKSSHSSGQGGQCVELTGLDDMIAVRDSKSPEGPTLALSRTAFAGLVRQIRAR